jgi:molybdate transport system substrate-binding protein
MRIIDIISTRDMKRILPLLLLAAFALPAGAATLTVAVAANVQYAFEELQAAYTKATGNEVKAVYNSSGKFVAQVMNGAPFDVFLSADTEYPEKLQQAGYTAAPPRIYAYGALVLWTMKDLDLVHWPAALHSTAVDKIAIANPKTAPYGRETLKLLSTLKLDEALKGKLVFGESIAQTNQYIHSKAVDAGFTAKSVVLAPQMKGAGKWVELPHDAYQPIAQSAVILKHGEQTNSQVSRQFYTFLFSPPARTILERYGYLLP